MAEAAPPVGTDHKRIMAALNVQEINKHKAEEVPHTAAILGVAEAAARAAIAGVFESSS